MLGSVYLRATFVAGALTLGACQQIPVTDITPTGSDVEAAMRSQDAAMSDLARLSLTFQRQTPFVVHFAFNSDVLDAQAKARLDRQAAWILDKPGVRFSVTGHTDKVGNQAYNEALGLRRAGAVARYLVGRGVDPSRLVTMVSAGEDHPLIDTENRERQNRRVETSVLEIIEPEVAERGSSSSSGPPEDVVQSGPGPHDGASGPDTATSPTDTNGSRESASNAGHGSTLNAGRGNGDETSDPGKSEGKNNGGDEV